MKRDTTSMSWQLKAIGFFMIVASVVAAVLVIFVLPGNSYLSSVLLLMLGLLLVCGVSTLVVGFFVTYRRVISRSMALPAIIVSRLLGRG